MSSISSRFITVEELEAQREARIAQGKPEEEQPYDPRSLYEQLEAQRSEKERKFEEERAFKNQVRGLNEEETAFLSECADKEIEKEKKEEKELEDILNKIEKTPQETLMLPPVNIKPSLKSAKLKKPSTAQRASLLGIVKRKPSTDTKKRVSEDEASDSGRIKVSKVIDACSEPNSEVSKLPLSETTRKPIDESETTPVQTTGSKLLLLNYSDSDSDD